MKAKRGNKWSWQPAGIFFFFKAQVSLMLSAQEGGNRWKEMEKYGTRFGPLAGLSGQGKGQASCFLGHGVPRWCRMLGFEASVRAELRSWPHPIFAMRLRNSQTASRHDLGTALKGTRPRSLGCSPPTLCPARPGWVRKALLAGLPLLSPTPTISHYTLHHTMALDHQG